jgi:hypothetical protein
MSCELTGKVGWVQLRMFIRLVSYVEVSVISFSLLLVGFAPWKAELSPMHITVSVSSSCFKCWSQQIRAIFYSCASSPVHIINHVDGPACHSHRLQLKHPQSCLFGIPTAVSGGEGGGLQFCDRLCFRTLNNNLFTQTFLLARARARARAHTHTHTHIFAK